MDADLSLAKNVFKRISAKDFVASLDRKELNTLMTEILERKTEKELVEFLGKNLHHNIAKKKKILLLPGV